jgi:hypothetical protein
MNNKSGQIFGLYLVILTGALCVISIGFFVIQQSSLGGALVSPTNVLAAKDSLDIFEIWEQEFIRQAFDESSSNPETNPPLLDFRESFLGKMKESSFVNVFLSGPLTLHEKGVASAIDSDKESFLKNVLYPEGLMKYEGDALSITRGKVGVFYLLESENKDEINFPIDFNFVFNREYSVFRDESGLNIKKV